MKNLQKVGVLTEISSLRVSKQHLQKIDNKKWFGSTHHISPK